jgi:hypothetical protein
VAHFYGKIHGQRGPASRLGNRNSGLQVTAASWAGCVEVNLYVRDGVDCCDVFLAPWKGAGVGKHLYSGPIGEYKPSTEV